jgi:hypothetical protein
MLYNGKTNMSASCECRIGVSFVYIYIRSPRYTYVRMLQQCGLRFGKRKFLEGNSDNFYVYVDSGRDSGLLSGHVRSTL